MINLLYTFLTLTSAAHINPALRRSLRSQNSVNIVLSMKGGVDAAIHATNFQTFSTRTERIASFSDALQENAEKSQASVMALLSNENRIYSSYESFWISNSVFIADASPELIQQLSQLPEVEEIHQEHIVQLETLREGEIEATVNNVEWGIAKVSADKVWSTGNTGQGIIVGSIDTGVRYTHETLKDNFVGTEQHGWYDPYKSSVMPNDENGHGTHTMGTICGSHGIGVAPAAKWLSCKGCESTGCTEQALLKCGQFILCPTDIHGNNKNCALAPHISSNSWGGRQGDTWYAQVVKSWHEAGIIPVFANGNSGPQCGTANSPGDASNVLGIGASTSSDTLASFSSVGPSVNGIIKPDLSAPGHNVRSAWSTSDSEYKSISGTSMATPHTAGVIALLLSHQSNMIYADIYSTLTSTCTTDVLQGPGKSCGNISEDIYPNNAFGHGVIDAEKAIVGLSGGTKPPTHVPTPQPTNTPTPTPETCRWYNGRCVPAATCRWSWLQWSCVRK